MLGPTVAIAQQNGEPTLPTVFEHSPSLGVFVATK